MVVNLSTPTLSYFERSETLTKYYENIRRFSPLEQDEEREMFLILKNENSTQEEKTFAKNKLINSNQRFVVAVAKRYATDDNILDLIEEGNIGLIESIESFDVEKGVKFMTWAVWYIRRAINFYLINYGNIVKKSNSHKTYHIMSQATNKFIQREYRQPTLEELADILQEEYNLDIKYMGDIIETKVTSIDASFNAEDEDTCLGDMALYNSYSASTNTYENNVASDFNSTLVASLLKKLSDKEAEIIKLLFGIGYDRAYEIQEVAKKVGYTNERVRQLKISILERLRCEYKSVIKSI